MRSHPLQVACLGEAMVEIFERPDGSTITSYGGDTLNSSVYLARLGIEVGYFAVLGDDQASLNMVTKWQDEGIATNSVTHMHNRSTGLYRIKTDDQGERSFEYFRDQAPAGEFFAQIEFERIRQQLLDCQYLYLSGISLSLFSEPDRLQLFDLVDCCKDQGVKIVFDSNYRPNRWPSLETAKMASTEMLPGIDLALPTLEDEVLLYGGHSATECAERYHQAGATEVVVKTGAAGCLVSWNGDRKLVPVPERRKPTDTTGAGDSFNAAYLAARIHKHEPEAAALIAHKVAAEVIMHAGAIIPRAAMAEVRL